MQYLDFDLEIGPGLGREYPLSARSAAGQVHGTLRFPFDALALENALLKLENALLQSGGTRRKALTEQEQAVQDFGRALFEALLEGDLRSFYYESKRDATRQGRGLRVRLHIRAAELAALPWEYLYDPRVPDYLCLSRGTPLVRYLDLPHPIEPLTIEPPLQILAMMAGPNDQPALDTARERERMRKALEPLEQRGLLTLTWLEGQTWRDLQRAMRGGPWHIFHFIGHGAFDRRADEGALALADDDGQTYLIHATPLGRLLANHGTLRLAILNACEGAKGGQRDLFSSTAATLAQRGIPAVLAMQYEISDHAAIELTRAFYESLADGLPVDAALAEARTAISLSVQNSLEWGTPVLYLRAQDGVLFDVERPPALLVSKQVEKTKEQWMQEGDNYYQVQRYSEALDAYEQATRLAPNDARPYKGKGDALWWLKRYEASLAAYEQAIHLDPNFGRAYYGMGLALSRLGQQAETLAAFQRATELDPTYPNAHLNKGDMLFRFNRYEEALTAYERTIQLNPKNAYAYKGKSAALTALGRTAEAEQALQQARELGYKG
ncbi:MAG TPA: CHAT domain-containing protein [Ktedonobacterales bacterium]|nr:CHAT domain-containing protein [Ktedonobacterales bacterium]